MKVPALAEIKKRLQVRTVLAVTIESGRIAVDLVRRDEHTNRVVRSFAVAVGASAVLADPEKWGQELAERLAAEGIREKRCVVCVPANWALTTSTEVPGISDEDLRGFLELRAEREFPVAAADLRLAHSAYKLPDGSQRVTLAGVPTKRLEAIERFIAAARCRAVSLSLGLDGCLPRHDLPAALHFLANGTHVDLIIAAGGGIAAVRSLPGPSHEEGATFDAAGFTREVRITLGRLPEALRQQVSEARFSGSPATAETLCVDIRKQLHRMGIESRVQRPVGAEPGAHPGAAIEAAEHHLRERPVAFEFLTPQVNRWQLVQRQFDDRRRRWLVLAAVAALILPILTFFVRSRMVSSLDQEWNGMRRKVADLESLQLRIREFRAWFEPTPQSLQVFEGLAAAFPESGDVWAKSVQVGEGNKVTCSGFARSQSALLGLLDRLRARSDVSGLQIQQVRGDNPIQFSITYKWGAHDAK
jgi:Tfp pilus assembly protein PilN